MSSSRLRMASRLSFSASCAVGTMRSQMPSTVRLCPTGASCTRPCGIGLPPIESVLHSECSAEVSATSVVYDVMSCTLSFHMLSPQQVAPVPP